MPHTISIDPKMIQIRGAVDMTNKKLHSLPDDITGRMPLFIVVKGIRQHLTGTPRISVTGIDDDRLSNMPVCIALENGARPIRMIHRQLAKCNLIRVHTVKILIIIRCQTLCTIVPQAVAKPYQLVVTLDAHARCASDLAIKR